MSDSTWTPRTAREREAVVGLCLKMWKECVMDREMRELETIADAIVPPVPAPPTRLREVRVAWSQGEGPQCLVRYENGYQFCGSQGDVFMTYATLYDMVKNRPGCLWSEEVFSACLDLKANPTEPAPDAVVEAIRELANEGNWQKRGQVVESLAAAVRALVRAEVEAETVNLTWKHRNDPEVP